MKSKTCLFGVAVMLLFVVDSCQHRYPVSLVEADSLVYSNPKAALQKLDSISLHLDTTEKADVMYLRLLKMTVKDKLNCPLSNLTEVCQLVDYYKVNCDQCLLARSYYLMGRIAFNLYDIARALSCFHKVLNILDENENLELRSIVYAQIGYVYSKQNNLLLAQKYYQKAYHYSCQRKDTLGMLYGLTHIAAALGANLKDS